MFSKPEIFSFLMITKCILSKTNKTGVLKPFNITVLVILLQFVLPDAFFPSHCIFHIDFHLSG